MAAFSESEGELQRLVGEASKRALTADERAEAAEHLDQLETEAKMMPVSYTHLTLPTICSV